MRKRVLLVASLVIFAALFVGCFFFGTKREPPITYEELETKQRVTFPYSYERVWDAALAALTTQKIEEIDRESGFVTTREKNLSGSQLDEYAWHPNYGSFRHYESTKAMDDARYWMNIKVSKIAEDTTRVQITPNFEIHIREWTWDTNSVMVWRTVRSKGVMEDVIAGKIARELGGP